MKTLSLLAATLVGGAVLCQQAQAIPITGTVSMSGTATLDNTFLGSATKATSFSSVVVGGGATGSYSTVAPGTAVTWASFGWNPSTAPITPLWSFSSGGSIYSFNLATLSVDFQNNSLLLLSGSGVLGISGGVYTPTAGDWAFTINKAGGGNNGSFQFSFSNSQTAAVPEGGLTIAFLGSAVLGLGMLRRRLS